MPVSIVLQEVATLTSGRKVLIVEYPNGFPSSDDTKGFLWFDTDDLSGECNVIMYPGDRVFYETAKQAIEDAEVWAYS